jgi:hypothetical protein
MKRLLLLVAAFLFAGTLTGCNGKATPSSSPTAAPTVVPKIAVSVAPAEKAVGEIFQIAGPTIIAFFPTTQSEVDKDADANETLSDFQNYLYEMKQPLQDAHIKVEQSYADAFQVEVDGKLIPFNAKAVESGYGYYFIEPGKTSHVVTDMMTDEDFQQVSKEYFGIVVPDPKPDEPKLP